MARGGGGAVTRWHLFRMLNFLRQNVRWCRYANHRLIAGIPSGCVSCNEVSFSARLWAIHLRHFNRRLQRLRSSEACFRKWIHSIQGGPSRLVGSAQNLGSRVTLKARFWNDAIRELADQRRFCFFHTKQRKCFYILSLQAGKN